MPAAGLRGPRNGHRMSAGGLRDGYRMGARRVQGGRGMGTRWVLDGCGMGAKWLRDECLMEEKNGEANLKITKKIALGTIMGLIWIFFLIFANLNK